MSRTIFSSEPHRGWLAPTGLLPFLCVLLVALSSVPLDYVLEWMGLVDAKGHPLSTWGFCVFLVLPFAGMGTAIWAWSRYVERRSLATLGLVGADRLRKHLTGIAVGIGMAGLVVLSIWLAGGYISGDLFPAFASPVSLFWIAVLLVGFTLQSGVEEFIFRGWVLSAATRRWNVPGGFIASSVAFTLLHITPRSHARELVMTFVFGIFACAWAWRVGSIWGVMGWHAGWNWFTGVGFAVPITGLDVHLPALVVKLTPNGPDALTGGADGPEGSLFTLAILSVATLLLLLWPRRSPNAEEHRTD
jgi:membrane protease YdiL (CAAX protease family)